MPEHKHAHQTTHTVAERETTGTVFGNAPHLEGKSVRESTVAVVAHNDRLRAHAQGDDILASESFGVSLLIISAVTGVVIWAIVNRGSNTGETTISPGTTSPGSSTATPPHHIRYYETVTRMQVLATLVWLCMLFCLIFFLAAKVGMQYFFGKSGNRFSINDQRISRVDGTAAPVEPGVGEKMVMGMGVIFIAAIFMSLLAFLLFLISGFGESTHVSRAPDGSTALEVYTHPPRPLAKTTG